jgi:two-component sensor histidine kinase
MLGSQQANSVALILNELVQNAAEHGFERANEGTVLVRLSEDGADRWRLEVQNDGDPLPPGFDPRQSDSLGLKIVESLARGDLNGDFSLQSAGPNGETIAAVSFPR